MGLMARRQQIIGMSVGLGIHMRSLRNQHAGRCNEVRPESTRTSRRSSVGHTVNRHLDSAAQFRRGPNSPPNGVLLVGGVAISFREATGDAFAPRPARSLSNMAAIYKPYRRDHPAW